MFNPRYNSPFGQNNQPFGRGNRFGSNYQYQTLAYGEREMQASGLISKVLSLLSFSFIFASIGAFIGLATPFGYSLGAYWMVAIAGFIVLIALNIFIQKPGVNLVLLYLFTFLEGLGIAPILRLALDTNSAILGQAFILTALTSLTLAFYSWTTKRDFSRLGDYLFMGLIVLLIAGVLGFFMSGLLGTTFFGLLISIFGIALFSGYVLYYVQRARYMANTLPNAIGLTVSIFITVLNLFLYILELLMLLSGNNNRRN